MENNDKSVSLCRGKEMEYAGDGGRDLSKLMMISV